MKNSFAYQEIVFLQGDEADEALKILNEKGEAAAIKHLSDWDCGSSNEWQKEVPWGTSDRTVFKSGYYLSYNEGLGYIGLTRPVSKREYATKENL